MARRKILNDEIKMFYYFVISCVEATKVVVLAGIHFS